MTVTANPQTASTPVSGNNTFTYAQLEGIWTQAGGPNQSAPIAAAIAMAESGGNSTATNQDSNGTVDRGLWQINSVHGAQSSYDVMTNARAAVAISNSGQNWTPWTTFNNGMYRKYLQVGVAPDTSAPINATNAAANQGQLTANTGPLPGGLWDPANWFLNPFGSAAGAAGGFTEQAGGDLIKLFMQGLIVTMLNPLIQITAGILGIGAGISMFVVGIWLMVRQTETGQTAERGAGTAVQAGASLFAPEVTSATRYAGKEGAMTTVTSTRRPAGRVQVGRQRITYRQPQVSTRVSREGGNTYGDTYIAPGSGRQQQPTTKQDLRNRANDFTNKKAS